MISEYESARAIARTISHNYRFFFDREPVGGETVKMNSFPRRARERENEKAIMSRSTDEIGRQLAAAWDNLLSPFAVPDQASAAAFADLTARYSDESRAYHNLTHLSEILAVINRLAESAREGTAIRLAAWFHDAIYDSRANDNEERSADLAETVLRGFGLPQALLAEVKRLILLTKRHDAAADDADGHILLDADLAILGADAARYDDYARAIRREYAWVADDACRAGRSGVLEGFLKRPRIYFTAALFQSHECPARRNLQRELNLLRESYGTAMIQVPQPP
jgi:predicted metal-dependent HD superfamily phosphohydrolase